MVPAGLSGAKELPTIRVLLVDDQPAVRMGLRLRLTLEPDMDIVGEACDGQGAIDQTAELQPDVVLMDINMPRMDGLTATRRLRDVDSDSVVVILSINDDDALRRLAQDAGARDFVCKTGVSEPLVQALRKVGGDLSRRAGLLRSPLVIAPLQ